VIVASPSAQSNKLNSPIWLEDFVSPRDFNPLCGSRLCSFEYLIMKSTRL
jgi:hypothetical protein